MLNHVRRSDATASRFRSSALLARERLEHPISHRRGGGERSATARDQVCLYALGFDNAHGIPPAEVYEHRHRFRHPKQLVAYEFRGADELICDFFAAVEEACRRELVPFEFESDEVELEVENEDDDNGTQVAD